MFDPVTAAHQCETIPAIERIDAALDLAARGFPVFAVWGLRPTAEGGLRCECWRWSLPDFLPNGEKHPEQCRKSAGKHPRDKDWQQPYRPGDPRMRGWTCDPNVIRAMARKWPNTNFGVVAGKMVVGVDVDSAEAMVYLKEQAALHGAPLPPTIMTRSGREDGHHLYVLAPPGMTISNGSDRGDQKIDVRGWGGLLVLPGSRHHTGRYYQWVEGHSPREIGSPALFPDWFTPAILLPPPRDTHGKTAPKSPKKARAVANATPRPTITDYAEDIERLRVNNGLHLDRVIIRRTCDPRDLKKWKLDYSFLDRRRRNYERDLATWEYRRGPGTEFALTDTSSSGYEMALAHVMASCGWTFQQAADGIMLWREKHFPGTELPGRSRMELTLIRAFLEAEANGTIRKKRGPAPGAKYRPRTKKAESESIRGLHVSSLTSSSTTVGLAVGVGVGVGVAIGDDLSVENSDQLGVGVGVGDPHVQADVSVHADVTDLPTLVSCPRRYRHLYPGREVPVKPRTEGVVDIAASQLVDLETIASAGLAVHCDVTSPWPRQTRTDVEADAGIGREAVPVARARHSCRAIRASMFPARRAYGAEWAVAGAGAVRFRGGLRSLTGGKAFSSLPTNRRGWGVHAHPRGPPRLHGGPNPARRGVLGRRLQLNG